VRGNSVNSFLAWLELIAFEALNAVFGVFATLALFAKIGWDDPGDFGTVLATILVIGTSALVAIYGHKLLFLSQKVFALSLTSVLAVVAVLTLDEVDWSHTASVSGSSAFGLFLVGMAVIVAAPLSYFATCADYPRYLPSDTPARQITWYTFAGAAVIILPLTFLGAALATTVDMSDPVAALRPLIPGWLFIIYAIAAAGGAIANNAITFYSSGLTIQSIGVPVARWVATALDCVLSTLVVLYILLVNEDFYTTTANFLPILNCWIGPFGAIMIADGVLRRFRYDPISAHRFTPESRYWYSGGFNMRGLVSLGVGIVVGLLTVNAPDLQGPLSKVLYDGDLSWIAPPIAAALCYWLLAGRTATTAPEVVEARKVPA
jgi:NCS1 family nucleobase:cation symporter-1